jgi:hypothetical protein
MTGFKNDTTRRQNGYFWYNQKPAYTGIFRPVITNLQSLHISGWEENMK